MNEDEDVLQKRIAAAEAAEAESLASEPETPGSFELPVVNTQELARQESLQYSLTLDDIAISRIKLGQALSKAVVDEDVRNGEFYMTPENTVLGKEFDVVVFNMFKHRAYFEPGQGLLCRSFDLVRGVGTPGIECANCALQQWPVDETGRTVGAPKCSLNYNYTGMVIRSEANDEASPLTGLLTLGRTSAPAAKQLNTMQMQRNGKEYLNPETGEVVYPIWCNNVYRLSSRKTEGRKGTYYIVSASYVSALEGNLFEEALSRASALTPRVLKYTVEAGDSGNN
jgi:hypothetical protein